MSQADSARFRSWLSKSLERAGLSTLDLNLACNKPHRWVERVLNPRPNLDVRMAVEDCKTIAKAIRRDPRFADADQADQWEAAVTWEEYCEAKLPVRPQRSIDSDVAFLIYPEHFKTFAEAMERYLIEKRVLSRKSERTRALLEDFFTRKPAENVSPRLSFAMSAAVEFGEEFKRISTVFDMDSKKFVPRRRFILNGRTVEEPEQGVAVAVRLLSVKLHGATSGEERRAAKRAAERREMEERHEAVRSRREAAKRVREHVKRTRKKG